MSELKPENKMSLFNTLGNTIRDVEIATDAVCQTLKILDECNIEEPFVINYCIASMHLNFIYLDFCAAYRMHLGSETNYEKRFGIAQLYTIFNEGYKRLYGFDHNDDKTILSKTRKESIWYKYMRYYENSDLEDIMIAYNIFSADISSFNNNIVFDKEARCIVCHYPNDFIDKYRFLSNLNAEAITQGAIEFMKFIEDWRKFLFVVERHLRDYIKGCCGTANALS